ncbi:MAG: hypothetical protein BGO26_20000 [Actinobacteria bacterium 69-20]|jgi:adenylyltransferase/sulfurtransferase|nr:molybdopterin-synthase adenylyltransferase MoeB [Actinomycetota bacterium]OJV24801.1 MAG: hypothetical protein BGO26_20000 [Actinobacteria bacterium 69-20]
MTHSQADVLDSLSAEELARYSRHIMLPNVGVEGQRALRKARVAVVGAGGLGSPAALYLAAAGVGHIGVIDDDTVDLTNLQRQIAHTYDRVGVSKTASIARSVHAINPATVVEGHDVRLSPDNALDILADYDVVLDGTDNYTTRYLVSDACVLLGKAHVWASVFQFEGQIATWWAQRGPCYRCMFPTAPQAGLVPSCAEGGVFGALCGVLGSMQVAEVLKIILNIGTPLIGRLRIYDALESTWDTVTIERDPQCPACGVDRTIIGLQGEIDACQVAQTPNAVAVEEITARELAALITGRSRFRLIDVRGPAESEIVTIPGAESIPLQQFELGSAAARLDPGDDIVVFCRSGARSARAVSLLLPNAVARARSLAGGVLAWVSQIDPSLPSY